MTSQTNFLPVIWRRRITSLILLGLLFCAHHGMGEEEEPARANKSDITIEPESGEIRVGAKLTLSFPTAMVTSDRFDVSGQPCPFVSEPALPGDFLWKSPTEGVFTISAIVADTHYNLTLRTGLKDAAGKPVASSEWSASYETPKYSFSTDYQERKQLSSRPQIPLESTYDVRFTEAADRIYFQDRDTRARLPSEVILSEDGPSAGSSFSVDPREPLPVGHTFDLIVEGLLDSASRKPLSHLAVFSLGTTAPLRVEWVGAFNDPLNEPVIRIKFDDEIDPRQATASNIKIEPALENAHFLAQGEQVEVAGDFDPAKRYQVTISPHLFGNRGYGLAVESRWGATFQAKPPSIIFPSSTLFVRARKTVRFPFLQVNAPTVTWKFARIPLEKLTSVAARAREFTRSKTDPLTGENILDPRTGFNEPYPTELLVDAFQLPVESIGRFEATTDDTNVRREAECIGAKEKIISGVYLFEATSILANGRMVGNRSIVNVSDYVLTRKRTETKVLLHVSKMSDLTPVAGVWVRAVTDENIELARAATDENGTAEFTSATVFPAKGGSAQLFIADTNDGPALQFTDENAYSSGSDRSLKLSNHHAEIISDRNLYAPGQLAKIKGMVRDRRNGQLSIPEAREVRWRISETGNGRVAGEGTTSLSPYGGWEAEWTVPDKLKLGEYEIRCQIGGQNYDAATLIKIEEFRIPLFSSIVETEPEVGSTAHATVSSVYFHGAPNAGAHVHWKATWTASNASSADIGDIRRFNQYGDMGPAMNPDDDLGKTVEGDSTLDDQGFTTLICQSPYTENHAISRATVFWRAEVTSADGQTITGGETGIICFSAARLGVVATERTGPAPEIKTEIDAIDKNDAPKPGLAVRADLYHVVTKTVKEKVAPFVFRYRNTDEFTKVSSQESKTPAELIFPADATGRYVVAVHATEMDAAMVSNETTMSGDQTAELPVENESTFKISHRVEPYLPGDTAELSIEAAFAGTAWVSIETDEVLDTFLVSIKGNAGKIDLPIRKEYAPNATVAVYLTRPGGESGLPVERFAYSEILVRRPDHELKLEPHLRSDTAKPGESVKGDLFVTSEGKPVEDADVALLAVDDAVLKLGDWQLPNLIKGFYPDNSYTVRSFKSLDRYEQDLAKASLYQKGFTIGGGGDEGSAHNVRNIRRDFKVLAFWQGSAKTDSQGKISFEFTAPDNLTAYRLIAIGQTKSGQFGGDASGLIKISKPLQIETALPRFLRDGDEVELRAVARQKSSDSAQISVHCETDPGCQLESQPIATATASREASVVFRFQAKVINPDLTPIKVRFTADAGSESDAVEIILPVQAATITRKESVVGAFAGAHFDAAAHFPETWKKARGTFGVTISTSPWLPKIAGLPTLLDYPHGCFEQISSRLLSYSLLANLLAYLPDASDRDAEYRTTLERGIQQFSDSLLPGGDLPYWPGGSDGNPFVTCQAFWAVNEAIKAGFKAPDGLKEKLARASEVIASGRGGSISFNRSFALFVLAESGTDHDLKPIGRDLYLQRNENGDEGRAFLALALHRLDIMPKETEQLLREIDAPVADRAFNPNTFTSVARADAVCAYAFNAVSPKFWTSGKKEKTWQQMLSLMDSATSLSTQENLWLLLEFKSMLGAENFDPLLSGGLKGVVSPNGSSMAWLGRKMGDNLVANDLNKRLLTFLMQAEYHTDEVNTDRVDHGFRLERVLHNLTEPKRDGAARAPFKLGDKILITFRVNTAKLQNYVVLEDPIPSGLEIVNPDLALIGKFFEVPTDPLDQPLELSHSELRDKATLLYFNRVGPGVGIYSVLARATAAGTFRWPATQIVPMYENRFFGLCPSSLCVISGD
jgi:alpha-2-macroglobulin